MGLGDVYKRQEYCSNFTCPSVSQSARHGHHISTFLHCARFWTIQTIYFLKGNDTRTFKTMFPCVWLANTQIQIHKYTNTTMVKAADRHDMCYIYEKGNDIRTSKIMFPGVWLANTQIQIHNYTNTASVKVADRPNMCYIFEKVMVRGPQKQCFHVSDVQIHKYKYTNTASVKVAIMPGMCYIFEKVLVHGLQR